MSALFDALYFRQIVSFLWIKILYGESLIQEEWPASVLEMFSTASLFFKPFTKNAFLFYEGFFGNSSMYEST